MFPILHLKPHDAPELPLFLWGPVAHQVDGSLGHPSPHPERHLDWFSCFGTAYRCHQLTQWPCYNCYISNTTALLLRPFHGLFSRTTWPSWYQKGKTSLDLNEANDNGILGCSGISWTICWTICTSLQRDNHTNTSSLNFYRPDALRDAQPTVSKHWRQCCICNNRPHINAEAVFAGVAW